MKIVVFLQGNYYDILCYEEIIENGEMGSLNVKVKLSSCFNINIRPHVTHDFLSLRRRTALRPRRPPPPTPSHATTVRRRLQIGSLSLSHHSQHLSFDLSPPAQSSSAASPSSPPISKPTPLFSWPYTFACVPPPLPESWFWAWFWRFWIVFGWILFIHWIFGLSIV
ncbi:unnamed protein product [Citrullus colocynthis]|uniref:Uncharacterized protein n=1 Tax=Citrullus colocynthis TaxID=252529 RepID=A0ABP0Y475_9ROSI